MITTSASLVLAPVAMAAEPVPNQPVSAADHPRPDDGRARLKVIVSGKLLDQPARIKVHGVSGPALGYQRTLRVRDSKVLRRAPLGGYRLRAKVIKVGGDPKADPAFRDDTRTAAPRSPLSDLSSPVLDRSDFTTQLLRSSHGTSGVRGDTLSATSVSTCPSLGGLRAARFK